MQGDGCQIFDNQNKLNESKPTQMLWNTSLYGCITRQKPSTTDIM